MPLHGPETPDENLVAYYKATNDKQAVGELFKRHSLMCFAVCNKYLKDEEAAKDATMSIFEKLFDDLLKHDVLNFKSWFHTVSKNYCLMQLRKQVIFVREEMTDDENESFFVELKQWLHHDNENKETTLLALEKAMVELNEGQRECIDLFYLKQKSYRQICDETGYTDNEVKSYIQNGKRNLKITLGRHGITFFIAILAWIQHSA